MHPKNNLPPAFCFFAFAKKIHPNCNKKAASTTNQANQEIKDPFYASFTAAKAAFMP